MAHTELDLRERRIIEDMLNAKISISKIAAELGRHRSTIYRDIKRNFYTDGELPYLSGYYCVMALLAIPHCRHLSIADLQHFARVPLRRGQMRA